MQVIDGVSVSARDRVLLIQVGEKQVLIGVSPGGISSIATFDEAVIDPQENTTENGFSGLLQRAVKKQAESSTRRIKGSVMKRIFLIVIMMFFSSSVMAAGGLEALTITTNEDGGQSYSLTLQVLILMTVLTLLPAIFLMMTSFTRIIIVLAILRQALGTAQTPSSQILIGIALFLTFFIMAPVFDKIYEDAATPYLNEEMDMMEALQVASLPLREFMMAQTRETDHKNVFRDSAKAGEFSQPADVPLSILVPSFLTSELKTAFQIGFLIFIPFLVIDLVVASVLMSMGMMMLSPMIISLAIQDHVICSG